MGNRDSKVQNYSSSSKTPVAKVGDIIPNVIWKVKIKTGESEDPGTFEWRDISSHDVFKGKRVVMFSIPGAFTPVCTCDHLPSFQKYYDDMRAAGADEVFCISVNDAFVMRQWGVMQGLELENKKDDGSLLNPGNFKTIKLIPDGAARFTRGMGMSCRWENIGGFGERSWRYSAVIQDCKIEKLFLEEDGNVQDDAAHGPEPFLVSDGLTMLTYLKEHPPPPAPPAP